MNSQLWLSLLVVVFSSTGELCPVTDITVFEDMLASVGEDGRIVITSLKENEPFRIIGIFL